MKSFAVLSALISCLLLSHGYEMDNIGRVVRGHLGALYDLRSKLTSTSTNSPAETTVRKESRGYSFHYSPAEISHPHYSSQSYQSSSPQEFQSRIGKVAASSTTDSVASIHGSPSSKWKTAGDKSWDKYSKLTYKTLHSPHIHSMKESSALNSFNIHHKSSVNSSRDDVSLDEQTTMTNLPTTTASMSTTPGSVRPLMDLTPLKSLSQGLNSAMTQVLTQKLMGMIDQEVPQGFLTPLKHLVSSGNRMVEFWDKRGAARDGKNPGIVEMLGYGLDQLKKFRDGQAIKASDPVANLTSASKTLIQGMLTVKKLTNRVLGYDTEENAIESRGGYGHDSYGHGGGYGHHVSYGGLGGLDPFSLLAALAFGAFLLQLLLTLLNTSARSLDVVDLNTPLMMSDFHVPTFMSKMDSIFGTPTTRHKRSVDGEENVFDSFIEKLDGVFKTYNRVSKKPECARVYMCRLAVQDSTAEESSVVSQLYVYGLGHMAKDKSATDFVKSIQSRIANGENVDCNKIAEGCDPSTERQWNDL